MSENLEINVIPKGWYCYDDNGQCPYWEKRSDREEMESGFCNYLGQGDLELNELHKDDIVMVRRNGETKRMKRSDTCCISLLWDECKECGINISEDE